MNSENSLSQGYQLYVTMVGSNINEVRKIRDSFDKFSDDLVSEAIDEEIISVQKQINETKKSLTETEFPLVSFPLELIKTVIIFPVAVAIGFIVCMNFLKSAIYFRYDLILNCYTDSNRDYVDSVVPLWINKSNPLR